MNPQKVLIIDDQIGRTSGIQDAFRRNFASINEELPTSAPQYEFAFADCRRGEEFDPELAIEAYEKEQPAIILCDMEFEDIQNFGCRVIEKLCDHEIDTPFALYANLEETDPRSLRAKKAGVSAIIPKTLHPGKLREFLGNLKIPTINRYEVGFDGEMIGVYEGRCERQAINACRQDKGDTQFDTPLRDQLKNGMIANLIRKSPPKPAPRPTKPEPELEM